MQKKVLLTGLLISFFIVPQVNAATVSFLVIESGLPREAPESRYSAMWEKGLMDVFFDMGHIVSNAPRMRLAQPPADGFPNQAESDFDEAREGRMGYFLVAIIAHPSPHDVTLRLFKTDSQEMVSEYKYTDKTYKTEKEEYENVKTNIRVMAARLSAER